MSLLSRRYWCKGCDRSWHTDESSAMTHSGDIQNVVKTASDSVPERNSSFQDTSMSDRLTTHVITPATLIEITQGGKVHEPRVVDG